ncbi:hypothetical protein IHE45_14G041500 [Dioscorea alata]|uniref:Uncharacterized protein n=1 Tax=Dioscorea alata TaxID=55571 RepID=A0ACB7URA4_DIOAL|nr:hypothetical protein IHE45_14G041500 [Dioscorea alata]
MGSREGSNYRGSFDHPRHKACSLADQKNHPTHSEHDSVPFTSPPAPQPVVSTHVVLPYPLASSASHAFVGSSSSSIYTPCVSGGTTPDDRPIDPARETPVPMDRLSPIIVLGRPRI